jgi:hypothetical protein
MLEKMLAHGATQIKIIKIIIVQGFPSVSQLVHLFSSLESGGKIGRMYPKRDQRNAWKCLQHFISFGRSGSIDRRKYKSVLQFKYAHF